MAEHTRLARSVQVQFKHDVTSKQVMATLEEVFRMTGCMTCGIRGIDLNLLGGDPEMGQLAQLPGIAGVVAR